MEEQIINKVASSGLISLDLEDFYPKGERIVYDLADNLFMGMILKEKDFREYLKSHDWSRYQDAYVGIICSADAIVPTWSYMLLTTYLEPVCRKVVFGDLSVLEAAIYEDVFQKMDWSVYESQRVVVKGCSNITIPEQVYVSLSAKLRPLVRSLMFGEPCSTVPLYKSKAT
ncbi:MAG: DUF2480 family protein [Leadbetterella sp.]